MRRAIYILTLLIALTTKSYADNLGYSKYHPLLFGVDVDYAPFEYVDDDGFPHGLDVELTQELMKRLDIPFTYSPNSWKNIAGDVIHGRVDLGMMVYSTYRKDSVNYSRPVFRLYYQIVYRMEDQENIDSRNLSGKHVAYMASRPITELLEKQGAHPHVVEDLPLAMTELSEGKYDAVICFRYQVRYLIEKNELNNLVPENMTLAPREYCYVSHSKPLIDAIDGELVKMKSEGRIIEIYGNTVTTLSSKIIIPHWVWYTIGSMLLGLLVIVVIQQHLGRKKLNKEVERSKQSEQHALRNEKRALESEKYAIRSRQKAELAEQQARRSEHLKTVFLANVSHALRTPLNAIIGFSDIMRTDTSGMLGADDRQELLESINKNGQQLLYFINELIQLSEIEGTDMKFERSMLDMHELMGEFRSAILPQVKEGVEVFIEGPEELYPILDQNRMRIVVMHMLRNAAQHTESGFITLRYKRERAKDLDGKERDGLRIDVADTGAGVPVELRDNIFALLSDKNTFLQNDMPGLGMSICAAIVHAARGHIRLESETGLGSTFIHWIPCEFGS